MRIILDVTGCVKKFHNPAIRGIIIPNIWGRFMPKKILVVDDDRLVTKSLKKVLENTGYLVSIAETGEQASLSKLSRAEKVTLQADNLRAKIKEKVYEKIDPD